MCCKIDERPNRTTGSVALTTPTRFEVAQTWLDHTINQAPTTHATASAFWPRGNSDIYKSDRAESASDASSVAGQCRFLPGPTPNIVQRYVEVGAVGLLKRPSTGGHITRVIKTDYDQAAVSDGLSTRHARSRERVVSAARYLPRNATAQCSAPGRVLAKREFVNLNKRTLGGARNRRNGVSVFLFASVRGVGGPINHLGDLLRDGAQSGAWPIGGRRTTRTCAARPRRAGGRVCAALQQSTSARWRYSLATTGPVVFVLNRRHSDLSAHALRAGQQLITFCQSPRVGHTHTRMYSARVRSVIAESLLGLGASFDCFRWAA